ncbi:hypothetical protein Tco_0672030 [Tanacetum coccineum]
MRGPQPSALYFWTNASCYEEMIDDDNGIGQEIRDDNDGVWREVVVSEDDDDGCLVGGMVMAISVISISLDSSKESVGTSTARVILFGTILTVILAIVPVVDLPVVHDDTPLIPTETPTIPPVISTLPHTSLFLYTDSFDSDTSKRPPSHDPYEVTVARWRSRVAARPLPPSLPTLRWILPAPPGLPRRSAILILPGQPILVG